MNITRQPSEQNFINSRQVYHKPAGLSCPILPDPDGSLSRLVSQYLEDARNQDALTERMERDRTELISLARPFHHRHDFARRAFSPTVEARAREGGRLSIAFTNSYRAIVDEAALLTLAGPDGARLVEHTITISIPLKDPPKSVMDLAVKEIRAVLRRCGLSPSLTIEEEMKPVKWFHQQRHRLFTPEQNAEIDQVAPCKVILRRPGLHSNAEPQNL